MSLDGATIEVLNWEKYNPRHDSKKPSWFRMENAVATGPGFFGLDCEQKWLWVFVLSLVSEKNGEPITWNPDYCTAQTGIKESKQEATFKIFEKFGRLRVAHATLVPDSPTTIRNDTNDTNVTNERTNERGMSPLVEIWNQNRGGLPGVKGCASQRKKHADARWEEQPDRGYWEGIVQRMAKSPFLTGQNDRGWRADFDFLCRPETRHKVEEGKYDYRDPKAGPPKPVKSREEIEEEKMYARRRAQMLGREEIDEPRF